MKWNVLARAPHLEQDVVVLTLSERVGVQIDGREVGL